MKIAHFSIYLGLLLCTSAVSAQEQLPRSSKRYLLIDDINSSLLNDKNLFRQPVSSDIPITDLSLQQKEQLRDLGIEKQKKLNQLNNRLKEKRARLRSLEAQDKLDINAINSLIDEQAELIANKMKVRADYKQKVRTLLTEEQRIVFDAKML